MSLSTDILARADINLVATPRQRKQTKRGKIQMPRPDHIPGISFSKARRMWKAYFYNGSRTLTIGEYPTKERAFVALRLFKLWRRRGFPDAPNKPDILRWTRWDYSELS